ESDQTLRFVAEKARALDHLFQLILLCVGERSRGRKSPEQQRRYHVDAFVSALRAEDRRHEQLKRRLVIKFAMGVRVRLLESRKNVQCVGSHRFLRNSTACCFPQLASAAIAGSWLLRDAHLSPTFYDERFASLQLYDCAFH